MIKRLTERDEYGNADIIGVDSAELQLNLEFDELNKVTDALNRLAAYEDSQMTPEEVVEIKKHLNMWIEICKENNVSIVQFKKWAEAEQEGRLVVLPCKAGDSIYPINIDRELNKPPLRVTGFRFSGFDNEGWIEIGLLKYKVSEIGKTVFLTREEAEKALQEGLK
jgi:hypothetical protein